MSGDIRNANPDQLEELANKLWPIDDGGAYGRLVNFFERARALDAGAAMASLEPLLTWLMDAAGQMRDGAAILRGDNPNADLTAADLAAGYATDTDEWEWEVFGQQNADSIVELARQDDLSEEEMDEMRGLLADFAEHPDFAAYLVDELGVTEFLGLWETVDAAASEEGASSDALALRDLLNTTLDSAFSPPGDVAPYSDEYQNWIENTVQGQRYQDRLDALAEPGLDLATDLFGKGQEMTDSEVDVLATILEAGAGNPEFSVEFTTEIGAENLMNLWSGLIDPQYGDEASGDRAELLTDLQGSLGLMLGTATSTDDARMEQWQEDVIGLGDQQFGEYATFSPYGFQLMSSLMGSGQYGTDFLTGEGSYGEALLAFERSSDTPGGQWAETYSDNRATVIGDAFRVDPITGYMDALANNPEAATAVFAEKDTMDYLLRERYELAPGLGSPDTAGLAEDGGVMALQSTADALLAATTGNRADEWAPAQGEHSDQQMRIFENALEIGFEMEDDFPPDLRDGYARMLGSYSDEVYATASHSFGDDVPLDPRHLAEMSVQVSRSPESYEILHQSMNVEFVQRIAADSSADPELVLEEVGRAEGFLSYGRYEALEIDKEEASAPLGPGYEFGGYLLGEIPFVGTSIQNAIDKGSEAWVAQESERIEGDAQNVRAGYYEENNGYLMELANQWTELNPEPAPPYAQYSEEQWGDQSEEMIHQGAQSGFEDAAGVLGVQLP
ncbi:hypothetical protein [Streptomyces sp. B6B3]|uniref:hypothetical protein n=1 Tax=Streptomyces sp. B6B3 TaxID=3153570 RepID=UPI00325E90DE